MATKKKSYLKKSLNELLNEMEHLGGGINVKLCSQELICLLPSLHNPFLSQGQSDKEYLKDDKYVLLSSNKQATAIKKTFKYTEVLRQQEDLMNILLDEKHFYDWFLQGFNLNMILFGRAINVHALAVKIISKYEEANQGLRVQSVRFSPRSSDNFYTENMEDLFSLREITKVEESGSFIGQQAIKYLETLSQREQLETKIKKISTDLVRITFCNGNKACELNLICLYDDLFIHSSYQTKYEIQFEKSFLNLLNECKSVKYLPNTESLSRASAQKTKLLEYLQKTVFGTSKNIIVADYSSIDKPNSQLSKYENILLRLMCIDKFNEINTICHRYSFKSYELQSESPNQYNTITNRYSMNFKSEKNEENNERSTIRRQNQSHDRYQCKENIKEKISQVSSFSPTQNKKQYEDYDLPLQQQPQFDYNSQNNTYSCNNEIQKQTQKKTFRQEMQDLLSRIKPQQEKECNYENSLNEIQEKQNEQLGFQIQDKKNLFQQQLNNNLNKSKSNLNNSLSQNTDKIPNQNNKDYLRDDINLKFKENNKSLSQHSIQQNTLLDVSNQENKEKKISQVSRNFSKVQSKQSNQHKQLLEECYQQQIDELTLQIQEVQARYEIELSEQREVIKNQNKKITLLGQEACITDLVRVYESEIFRYVEMQKKLRQQISFLTEVKIAKDNQKNLNTTQKQNIKQKDMIASLNLELAELEDEVSKLKRERRSFQSESFQSNRQEKRISDLELQRDQLIAKNDELMNSLQAMNSIVQNLKTENQSLNKCVFTITQQNQELSEDNKTLQQIQDLQNKVNNRKK